MKYNILKRANPLKPSDPKKFYAAPVYAGEVTMRALADEISEVCTLTPADVIAVIEALLQRLPALLKNGQIIRLGDFGTIKLSFSAKGKIKQEEVHAGDIKNVRVLFLPSVELKRKLQDIGFAKN